MSFDNKSPVILITGAARRVGAEIARQIHAHGAIVVLHYRHTGKDAAALADELNTLRPDSAATIGGDIGREGVPEQIAAQLLHLYRRIDGLVNNASSFFPTPIGHIDNAAWNDLIGSNLKGPLFLSQAFAPALEASRGSIVNIADIHAQRPLKNYPLYSTAKAGLIGLTRALAVELAPGVRVNAVAPGAIEWPEDGQIEPDKQRRILDRTLLKRKGEPGDIARAVCFLLFDANYTTGQILTVDGGRSIYL